LASYVYDNAIMTAAVDSFKSVCDVVLSASEAVDRAASVISTISSAGGDLGTEVGGTVLQNIRKANSSVQNTFNTAKKLYGALESAKDVLNKVDRATEGNSGVINSLASISKDELGEIVIDSSEVIGEVITTFSDDPVTDKVVGNVGEVARAIVDGTDVQDRILDSYAGRLQRGEIGAGEYFTGGLSAGVTNGVITIADGVANAIGLDIPNSWNQNASDFMGNVGEQGYRLVSRGIRSIWNVFSA